MEKFGEVDLGGDTNVRDLQKTPPRHTNESFNDVVSPKGKEFLNKVGKKLLFFFLPEILN